ncbi:uncharacterized protein IWZ02DRAFT_421016 [Phyllosticta citriasiana]|uniref:uncharacterized protein n=1 Tax=Phyllosticta citriasiana TaxID=595635 RepID=UPI0030FDB5F2
MTTNGEEKRRDGHDGTKRRRTTTTTRKPTTSLVEVDCAKKSTVIRITKIRTKTTGTTPAPLFSEPQSTLSTVALPSIASIPGPLTRPALSSLLRAHLSSPLSPDDPLHACGASVTALLPRQPRAVLRIAHAKIHAFPFKDVPACWLRAWSEGCLWACVGLLSESGGEEVEKGGGEEEEGEEDDEWLDDVVRVLDMGLILAGGVGREKVYEWAFAALEVLLDGTAALPRKRQKVDPHSRRNDDAAATSTKTKRTWSCPSTFPPSAHPPHRLRNPIPHIDARHFGFEDFQAHLDKRPNDTTAPAALPLTIPDTPTPLILTHALSHWPALTSPTRRWSDPRYLLRRALGGRRLVPVEIGRSYTDEGWGQRIMRMGEFMRTFVFRQDEGGEKDKDGGDEAADKRGYLAQHDLVSQIPRLRADICIPDYVYTVPPSKPNPASAPAPAPQKNNHPPFPLLNSWFGPSRTVSPLHTDPYHNMLAQVVGAKFVRLYPPSANAYHAIQPRGVGADGVDLGNTSCVDVGEVLGIERLEGNEDKEEEEEEAKDKKEAFEARHPGFLAAPCFDAVLEAGEALYVPKGWWHYVESVATSFSVSFWWDAEGDDGDER